MTTVTVHSLMGPGRILAPGAKHTFGHPTAKAVKAIADADVILAVDVSTERKDVVFGRGLLQDAIDAGEAQQAATLCVELDQETPELEWLCTAVQVVKGYHEYEGGGE